MYTNILTALNINQAYPPWVVTQPCVSQPKSVAIGVSAFSYSNSVWLMQNRFQIEKLHSTPWRGHWLAVCFVIKWQRHHCNEAVYQSLLPACLHSMKLYEWRFLKLSLSPWLLCMHKHKANYFKGTRVFTLFIFLESITAAAYASVNSTNRGRILAFWAVCYNYSIYT